MIYVPSNIKAFANTRETSDEIALAIFEIANENEREQVIARAWKLADTEETQLNWGNERIRR
jgi:hypothetical protein